MDTINTPVEEAKELSERMGFEKFMSKKTGRFFSNVQSKGKQEHPRKGKFLKDKKHKNLQSSDEKYVNKAPKKEDMLIEKYGS